MNNPVSGESSASGQGPHIAVGPAAVAIRRPELWNAWNLARPGRAGLGLAGQGMWQGSAGRGTAWRGNARHGRAWNMARLGMAGQGTSRLGLARLGKECGWAGLGWARQGVAGARQGTWAGVTTSKHKTHTEHGKNTTQH